MSSQNLSVFVAMLGFGACLALPLGIAAYVQHQHEQELVPQENELRAECIAVLLNGVPRKDWLEYAIESKDDPYVCKMAMETRPNDEPGDGPEWDLRIHIGRSVINP